MGKIHRLRTPPPPPTRPAGWAGSGWTLMRATCGTSRACPTWCPALGAGVCQSIDGGLGSPSGQTAATGGAPRERSLGRAPGSDQSGRPGPRDLERNRPIVSVCGALMAC